MRRGRSPALCPTRRLLDPVDAVAVAVTRGARVPGAVPVERAHLSHPCIPIQYPLHACRRRAVPQQTGLIETQAQPQLRLLARFEQRCRLILRVAEALGGWPSMRPWDKAPGCVRVVRLLLE